MFKFFNEVIADFGLENEVVNSFNIINMSNKLIYIEGHKGVISINSDVISVRVKKGAVCIYGKNLILKKISGTTLCINGEIKKIESY